MSASHNFGFLATFDEGMCKELSTAEKCFAELENYDLAALCLRRFTERFVDATLRRLQKPAMRQDEGLLDATHRLNGVGFVPPAMVTSLHKCRLLGNKGSHVGGGNCDSYAIVDGLRRARKLSVWYVGTMFPEAADLKLAGFKVPQTGNHALDQRNTEKAEADDAREAALSEEEAAEEARKAAAPPVVMHQALREAYDDVSEDSRSTLAEALEALRADPLAERWEYAPVEGASDDKIRTVPVTEALSLVAAVPAKKDQVFVLWAASPADALAWARTKRIEVHPVLGTVQLYDVAAVAELAEPAGKLFDGFSDDDLVRLGLPAPLLGAVRALEGEAAFHALAQHLPGECGDALELLLVSGDVDEVVEEMKLAPPEGGVDVEDFGVAVEHPATKRSFRMLEEDEDLEAALSGSIEAWRLFLHPDQRALVKMHAKGPVQVLGGAGTGKTVALIHRAAHLLQEVVLEGRVLVTTYTRNLATDLEQALKRMVGRETAARADVMNLHRLARRIARLGPLANADILQPEGAEPLWEAAMVFEALGFPRAFYESEWAEIVQAKGVADETAYLMTSRRGRGRRLGRVQRLKVWKVLDAFPRFKEERGYVEWADLVESARQLVENGQWDSPYQAVLADEVQDFTPQELKLLRALVPKQPNDLFVVGDAHQRIYGTRASMRRCGIQVQGRSRRLRVNYRTTEEIRDWGVRVLEGLEFDDLNDGTDTLAGYRSLRSGVVPRVLPSADRDAELETIFEVIDEWRERYPAEEICLTARTSHLARRYADALRSHGLDVVIIKKEEPPGPGIRVATMHRLKGLEFSCVLLAGAREGIVPLAPSQKVAADPEALANHERTERALLYVAATRARDQLVATSDGAPSGWLR